MGSSGSSESRKNNLDSVAAALARAGMFRRWIETAHAGFWVIDPQAKTTFVNPRMAQMLGYEPHEMLGASLDTFMDERGKRITALNIERRQAGIDEQHDFEFLKKDGTRIITSMETSPYTDAEGNYAGAVAFVSDVTLQREADRNARYLAAVVEAAEEAVISLAPDGSIRSWNPAAQRIFGYSPKEVIGQHIGILSAEGVDDHSNELLARAKAGDPPVRMDVKRQHKDGHELRVSLTLSVLLDQLGEVISLVGVIRDVTAVHEAQERERALEAQMLHAQKLESLGLLAGGIAHDFNNLLVSILGYADLASTELPASSPVQPDLSAIVEASRRASDLCRQLLAYAGRGRFVVQPVELSDTLSEIVTLLEVTIDKGVSLQLDLSNTSVIVEADVTQLRQVFMNLVTNASEAVGTSTGVIRISTGTTKVDGEFFASCVAKPQLPQGRYAFFEVADTGCGMDAETARSIFDPFFTTKTTGRGLGLAAVLGIIQGHGGAIRLRSELGRGTSFRVLLPLVSETHQSSAATPSTMPTADVVLVVDDESSVLQFARRALMRAGFEVVTAGSGQEAIARFSAEPERMSAVLLDVTMPGMDGHQTFSELRRIERSVPIILSSGFSEQETVNRLADQGLTGFLPKPYSVHELLTCVRHAIDSKGVECKGKR